MPEFYKYAERSADSEVNWYEIGKNLTDTLSEANRIREEKKEAYNQQTRDNLNALAQAPQGQDKDGNNFTNAYVSAISEQILMDDKLFKSGRMKESQYRLRRQNYTDGTNQLFDMQKLYQEEAAKTQEGIDNGTIQGNLAIANMSSVEGRANFSNSVATIDSLGDGKVGVALYENKLIDGKIVKVLNKNTIPVNVMRSTILHKPPMWQVDKSTTDLVATLGTLKDAVYKAASLSKAGSITEFIGLESLKRNPADAEIVKNLNIALDDKVAAFFTDPYKLTTILGEKTGNYDSKSYIFDKEEAAKDPTKILMTINPITQAPTIDKEGPHYKEQLKEASDWVKRDILMKMDNETKISTTSQMQRQDPRPKTADEVSQANLERDAKNFAVNTSNLLYGTDEQKKQSFTYFRGYGADIKSNPPGKPKGNYIMGPEGKYILLETETGDVTAGGRAAIGALLSATGLNFPQDLVFKNMKIGKKFNTTYSGSGLAAERNYASDISKKLVEDQKNKVIYPGLFNRESSVDTGQKLADYFQNTEEIQITPDTNSIYNDITITYTPKNPKEKGLKVKLNSNEYTAKKAELQYGSLTKFIKALPEDVQEKLLGPEPGTEETTTGDQAP